MAQKVQILLTDDIDGSEAVETVSFGLDGSVFEIDLSEKHANSLRKSLAEYIEHARKASGGQQSRRRRSARSTTNRERSAEIRDWAKERGFKVSERGRIPANIMAEFEQAQA